MLTQCKFAFDIRHFVRVRYCQITRAVSDTAVDDVVLFVFRVGYQILLSSGLWFMRQI